MMRTFQFDVRDWMLACFGPEITADKTERNYRFLEEALELVQANGCTEEDAQRLVKYVYSRPVGELGQEMGGVMVTLAALANTADLTITKCADAELNRVWGKIDQIREKQASKEIKGGPLP